MTGHNVKLNLRSPILVYKAMAQLLDVFMSHSM
jgi:hypothetical protein